MSNWVDIKSSGGPPKTAIVTGASQGIGAGIVKAFVAASSKVALIDGHIGEPATAAKIVDTALSRFKSIDG